MRLGRSNKANSGDNIKIVDDFKYVSINDMKIRKALASRHNMDIITHKNDPVVPLRQ